MVAAAVPATATAQITPPTSSSTTQILVSVITATTTATATATATAPAGTRTTLRASRINPTISTTAAATTTTSTVGSGCLRTCSPFIAVCFGPFVDDGSSSSQAARSASIWGGVAFAGASGLLALVHLVQGCHYRWKPAAAAVVGGLAAMAGYTLQVVGSTAHIASVVQPYPIAAAFVLIQLAQLCIVLYVHLLLVRLSYTRFLPAHDSLEARESFGSKSTRRPDGIWPRNSRWVAHWPVVALLACAAAVQTVAVALLVYGGLTTPDAVVGHAALLLVAADIMWATGLAAQGVVVLVLLTAVVQALVTLPPARPGGQQERGSFGAVPALSLPPRRRVNLLWLLSSTCGVLMLLIMRLVYRAVGAVLAAEGKSGSASAGTARYVLYTLVFEALPTCLALALVSISHAGWALPLQDVQHLQSGDDVGQETRSIRRRRTDNEEEAAEAATAEGCGADNGGFAYSNLAMQAPVPAGTPLEPRGVRSGLPQPVLTPAQILIQQRAIIQRQRQQQRQYWQRQWQRHREMAAVRQAAPSVSLPSSPAVEALARSSLSASLPVPLPQESTMAERQDLVADVGADTGRPPRLPARLSRDNFILLRFLNAPCRSLSSSGGGSGDGWRVRTRTTVSGSGRSRLADDPFAGFDGVGAAERYDRESCETCDSPDGCEKRGELQN